MDLLGRLALFLDRPTIPWKGMILGFGAAHYLFEAFLSVRQHRKLQETKPPKALQGAVSQEDYDKSQAYGRAKSNYGFISSFYDQSTNVLTIYYDFLPKLWNLTGLWITRYAPEAFSGEISKSLLFFIVFNIYTTVTNLPFSYYKTFVLEEKFGFNKQTRKLVGSLAFWYWSSDILVLVRLTIFVQFFTDMIKNQLLIVALGGPVLAGFLKIIQYFGANFFYYLWVFVLFVQAFAITIYPLVILPMFNKLTPLEPGKLKTEVEALATRLKFPLKHLYVIDGSKRSAHSNAYFYGLPWSKHIVIYDTLIEKSEVSEVVAVISHELGHWSEGHTTKLFAIAQFHMFYIFALFSVFISNSSLYRAFGFYKSQPILIGFLLFNEILQPLDTIVKLLMNILSRKFEYEADAFAVRLGYSGELAKSLIKLQVQNLATMDADWLYSSYHFTHPILPERLRALDWKGGKVE